VCVCVNTQTRERERGRGREGGGSEKETERWREGEREERGGARDPPAALMSELIVRVHGRLPASVSTRKLCSKVSVWETITKSASVSTQKAVAESLKSLVHVLCTTTKENTEGRQLVCQRGCGVVKCVVIAHALSLKTTERRTCENTFDTTYGRRLVCQRGSYVVKCVVKCQYGNPLHASCVSLRVNAEAARANLERKKARTETSVSRTAFLDTHADTVMGSPH
jgi:hypothetical protein